MDVRIYTSPTCGYCHQAKSYLAARGIQYTEYDVSRDRSAADEMVRLTGQMGVPVIMVDGQVVIGFDRPRLESLLAAGNGRRPRFGLKVADAGKMRPGLTGALVGEVARSSPGEAAGLRTGDVITGINMWEIAGAGDLERALAGLHGGDHVNVTLVRGQETLRTKATV